MEKNFNSIFHGGFSRKPIIKCFYAYDFIIAGLKFYCGDKSQWLPQYDEIVDWLKDNKGKGLLVMGSAGVGKSLLCRDIIPAIINEETERECSVVSAYQLSTIADRSFHRGVLMIDDVGVENDFSQFGMKRNIFCEIVDEFERYNGVLIITTNLTPSELEERYGERTIDRLKAICRFVVIESESFRNGTDGSHPIPERHRAYGVDFATKEDADKFRKEQDELYDGYHSEKYERNPKDSSEIAEGQPLKLYKGVVCALLKYDWEKIEKRS